MKDALMKPKKIYVLRLINLLIRGLFSFATLTLVLILVPVMAHALTPVTVAWNVNNPVPEGCILYWGTASRNYTNSHDAGNANRYTIPDLQEGVTYYFAATAYDSTGNESAYSAEISYTVIVSGNTHTIQASAGAHGSITPLGSVVVNNGASQTFTVTPDQDYQVLEVRVDGTLIGTATSYTFNNVTQDHTITASFIYLNSNPVDSDGDGVPDDQDAFPLDPNETTDTDGDGTGNNADNDDDEDGMPDSWEIANNLDPLVNDADGDPDSDGATNFEEYQAGTNPNFYEDHSAPYTPVLLMPLDNEIVSLTVELTTDEFYDPDVGDFHAGSQWQIVREDDGSIVFEQTSDKSLTSITISKLVLDEDTAYEWKVRFIDNHGATSEWSQAGIFLTDVNRQDNNDNGIPDHQEVDVSVDLDEDGTPDIDQDDIKCVYVEDGTAEIGVSIRDSVSVQSLVAIESENPEYLGEDSNTSGKPQSMPFGLLNFKLIVDQPGDETEVTIYLSEPAPFNAIWYKYDPINKIWQDCSEYTEYSADRKSVDLTLIDGGFGDGDGIENGVIIDPIGLGVASASPASSASSGSSGSSSSCFITSVNDNITYIKPIEIWKKLRDIELTMIFLVTVLVLFLKSKHRKPNHLKGDTQIIKDISRN